MGAGQYTGHLVDSGHWRHRRSLCRLRSVRSPTACTSTIRLERHLTDKRQCILVLMGAFPRDGTKELIAPIVPMATGESDTVVARAAAGRPAIRRLTIDPELRPSGTAASAFWGA